MYQFTCRKLVYIQCLYLYNLYIYIFMYSSLWILDVVKKNYYYPGWFMLWLVCVCVFSVTVLYHIIPPTFFYCLKCHHFLWSSVSLLNIVCAATQLIWRHFFPQIYCKFEILLLKTWFPLIPLLLPWVLIHITRDGKFFFISFVG